MVSAHHHDRASADFTPNDAPEMTFEIRIAEGAEAQRLRLEQTRVLWEVTTWLAQRRFENGQDHAA